MKAKKLWSLDKVKNVLIGNKIVIWVVKNILPLGFLNYLSSTNVQKNTKMFRSDFRKQGVYSKSITKTFSWNKFLVD